MFRNRTFWLILIAIVALLAVAASVYLFVIQPGLASPIAQEPSPSPDVAEPTRRPTSTPLPIEPSPSPTTAPTEEPPPEPTEPQSTQAPPPTAPETIIGPGTLNSLQPVQILEQHDGPVTAIAFSPDSALVASSSEDGLVRIWQVSDGALLHTLEGHRGIVRALDFSPDGLLLASGGDDRLVRIWQVDTGEFVREIRSSLGGRVLDIEFHPEGNLIGYSGHFCYVELRNVETGILRRTFVQPDCVTKFGGSAEFLNLGFFQNGEGLITGDGQPGGDGGSLQRWQVESYAFPDLIRGYDLVVRDFQLDPEEETLALALVGSPDIWLLDLESRMVTDSLEGHTFRVNSVTYSPDGRLLVSGSTDRTIRIWNPENGAWLESLTGHDGAVNMVRISPDGGTLASASSDGTVILWTAD